MDRGSKWSGITRGCQNFPLTGLLQINIQRSSWSSRYNSAVLKDTKIPLILILLSKAKRRTRSSEIIALTFLSVLPRVILSVISSGHVHDYERTISRDAPFSFARRALWGEESLEIYRFLLPSCRICHEQKGRMVSDRVRYIRRLRMSDTTMELHLEQSK